MSNIKTPVTRYHGAKFRLADWIMQFFPKHRIYVEPFAGSAGVLMKKPRSESEVYNDLDGDVVNLFRVLRDPELSLELEKFVRMTPYARSEFELAYQSTEDQVERARRTLVRGAMGFGSAGVTKHQTGFRIDSKREYGTASHLWAEYPDSIELFCKRLQGVLIENKPALEILEDHDSEETLFYVDPPYLHSTRQMGKHRHYYNHEMTDDDHTELLSALRDVQGFVVLSGYDNEIYQNMLSGWTSHSTTSRISACRGTAVRTEVVWLNPQCEHQQIQGKLFG